jgi:hypothetical protein
MSNDNLPPGRAAAIGDRIRWIVEERLGTTHTEFSRRLGVVLPQLSRWVNRPDHPPSERYLARMAELGGVPVAWLRYGVGEVRTATVEEGDLRQFGGTVNREKCEG